MLVEEVKDKIKVIEEFVSNVIRFLNYQITLSRSDFLMFRTH